MFRDRQDAAEQLADALAPYAGRHPLILAIPRGAVPMARILAERLGGELDVVLVRKIGSPFNPEVAVGAVDDGLATGATMIAALRAVQARHPKELLGAVPVAAADSLAALRALGFTCLCLHTPEDFGSVGAYYRSFAQVEDDEVVALLSG